MNLFVSIYVCAQTPQATPFLAMVSQHPTRTITYTVHIQNVDTPTIYINQSINQSIFECIMPHGTRAQTGPKQHYTQTTHIFTQKTVDLGNVSFTYIVYNSVYNSVKGLQGIGSSVRHYVPKHAFHTFHICTCTLHNTHALYMYTRQYVHT